MRGSAGPSDPYLPLEPLAPRAPLSPSQQCLGLFAFWNPMPFLPTKITFRGYYFTSRPDGQYDLRGRGQRRTVSFQEMQAIMNPPPRKKAEAPAK